MLLHNHLDIIGRNEPIQRKAKFWQSYVRALKGTDDIRAPEASHYSRYPTSRGIFRPLIDFPSWPNVKSIFDDPIAPQDRISVPGYRYLPISREIYGLSPRNIYPHHYPSLDRGPRYVTRVLTRSPFSNSSYFNLRINSYTDGQRKNVKPDEEDNIPLAKFIPRTYWDPLEGKKYIDPAYKHVPLVREYEVGPDGAKVPLYTYSGTPIYSRGGFRRPISQLFEPSPYSPISEITRDPWWWTYPQYRPYQSPYIPSKHSPYYLRDSYLSPVKRSYLWQQHPIRPFSASPRLTY